MRLDTAAVAPREQEPLTAGELAAASGKRSPALLILSVLVVLLLVGAIAFALRAPGEVALPQPKIDAGSRVVAAPDPLPPVTIDAGVPDELLPEPPPVEQKPTLRVAGRFGGDSWIVANQNGASWTSCRMTLPGQRVLKIGTFPQGSRDFPVRKFVFDAAAPQLKGKARVDCAQGFGLIPAPR